MNIAGLGAAAYLRLAAASAPEPGPDPGASSVQLSAAAMRALLKPDSTEVKQAWSFPHGSSLVGGSAVSQDGSSLYQTSYRKVFCLNASNGTPAWEYPTSAGDFTGPATVGPRGLVYTTSKDGTLHAINPADGTAAWTAPLGGTPGWGMGVGPQSELLVQAGGKTLGLNPEDGSVLWSSPVTGSELAVGKDGRLFATGDGLKCIVAYDRDSGQELWRKHHGHCRHTAAVGPDGTVYLGNVQGHFMALDPATGEIRWKFETGSHILYSPTVGPDGTIYAGNLKGELYAFDPETRDKKWMAKVEGEIRMPPRVAPDGSIILASDRNIVYGFEPSSGGKLWSQPAASYVHCQPAADERGRVYIGANNSTLYAYDVPSLRVQLDDLTKAPAEPPSGPAVQLTGDHVIVGQTVLPRRPMQRAPRVDLIA